MPEQVQVRITGMVITARYGSLSADDTLRTDAAFAKHLVYECGAAEYILPNASVNSDLVEKTGGKPVMKKAKQEKSDENTDSPAASH